MPRKEFNKATKIAAYERSGGLCEECGNAFREGFPPEYDHDKACGLKGDNSLENCVVLCKPCHSLKTNKPITGDKAIIARAQRGYEKRIKARVKKSTFPKAPPGYKFNWKTGRVEKTDNEREG